MPGRCQVRGGAVVQIGAQPGNRIAVSPAHAGALADAVAERGEAQGAENGAWKVDATGGAQGGQHGQGTQGDQDGHDAHRYVDEEDVAPVGVLQEPAGEDRTEGRTQQDGSASLS